MASDIDGGGSQTLDRGLRILEALAQRDEPTSIAELSGQIGLHRSIVYRLVRTLESHRLVIRDDRGHITLGHGLVALASGVERALQDAAGPPLRSAAEDLGATCFLVERDGDSAVTLLSAAPRRGLVTVAQRPGTVHPLGVGAPGRAVLAMLPESAWPPLDDRRLAEVRAARERGFAASEGEIFAGLESIAVPFATVAHPALAIAIVALAGELDHPAIAARLSASASEIASALAG